jgi:thiol-disulfide isomerase/thioredoxin
MTGRLIAPAAAVAAATTLGFAPRRRSGRFRAGTPKTASTAAGAGTAILTDPGSRLGEQATLVQFSAAFCAPCRPTRQILAHVAGIADGVRHVEIDAASQLDLVRRLRVTVHTPSSAGFAGLGGRGAPMARALADSDELHVLARPAGARP